jgi:hypothetical protein
MYSGETKIIDSGLVNITNMTLTPNSTDVLITQINDTSINITISPTAEEQNFTIVFYGLNYRNEEATTHYSGGGGGSGCIYNNYDYCRKVNLTKQQVINETKVIDETIKDLEELVDEKDDLIDDALKKRRILIIVGIVCSVISLVLFVFALYNLMKGGQKEDERRNQNENEENGFANSSDNANSGLS